MKEEGKTNTNKCEPDHRWGHVRGRPDRCIDCGAPYILEKQ